jgi:hypothetical protein
MTSFEVNAMDTKDSEVTQKQVAPGLQNEPAIMPFKLKGRFGAGGPPGNTKAVKHGVYCVAFTSEEKTEREEYARELEEDLGNVSAAQRSLIRRASWIEVRLRRNERASEDGRGEIASEHVLSWINSQRLLLCALGLERKQRPGPSLQEYIHAMEAKKQAEEPKEQE